MGRYEARHIPGSACAVCDENSKKNIMPRLPKDKEIVLVNDNEDYLKHMASMMNEMGLNARYLPGGLGSWKWDFANATDKDITANELKKLLDANSDLFLLDVREPDEFADWNIEGSHNIPLGKLSNSLDQIPHHKKIVTICPHGNRSKIAKFIMQSYGYDVQSLEGGLKTCCYSVNGIKLHVSHYKHLTKNYKTKLNISIHGLIGKESPHKRYVGRRIELINWPLEIMKNPNFQICENLESKRNEVILKRVLMISTKRIN